MFPWTHAAFGYLLFVSLGVVVGWRVSRAELLAVVVGTQFPDLVDKPLAWTLAVLPSGRSLGHSLVVGIPLVLAIFGVAWYRSHPEIGLAFGIGYLSHLVGDVYAAVYYWRVEEFSFLLYPILPPYPYDEYVGFVDFFSQVELTARLLLPFGLSVLCGLAFFAHVLRAPWYRHG